VTPLERLLLDPRRRSALTHVEHLPARPGVTTDWPGWVAPQLVAALQQRGVHRPWAHQAQAADLAHRGVDTVLATGTASGKSLAYQLPVITAALGPGRRRALYLAPTKALAHDQLRSITSLGIDGFTAATLDGDTPLTERDWVREHADLVLTNPDLLHHSLLPSHRRWRELLGRLSYVIVDECHVYRGVFGSHVALVLRRLLRLCELYGTRPTVLLCSATTADPAVSATLLSGREVVAVCDDTSARGAVDFALWEPPLTELRGEHGAPVRRSAPSETAALLADLVSDGVRTLAFVRSRRGVEVVAAQASSLLSEVSLDLASRVAAYRGGYLPEERREVERALVSGALVGVAATNALELGIDIAGLDAVLVAGWPGTLASLWQQAGRAGRSGTRATVVLVARDDPLDTYLVHHPQAVFGRPVESTVLDPTNPYVLGPHLQCAAAELPLTSADELIPGAGPVLADLVAQGRLRRRPTGWFWTRAGQRPTVDLRGSGGAPVTIVETGTGRVLGTIDAASADSQVHPGAVYLHAGRSWVVDALDLTDHVALVSADAPDFSTHARSTTQITIASVARTTSYGDLTVCLGSVEVTTQVVGYLRRRWPSGEVLGEEPLDLPRRELVTSGVWWTLSQALVDTLGLEDLAGALHAAEHAAIGLLPLLASCDRWDVGGVSTELHCDTGLATVFVHDGHPGGAGFAARGHDRLPAWLTATRDAVRYCQCPTGCPSCVQSPKCGNGNEPLHKLGAVRVLDAVLACLAAGSPAPAC
jgi:DEAD/DEAH box helicase domain-containing protein